MEKLFRNIGIFFCITLIFTTPVFSFGKKEQKKIIDQKEITVETINKENEQVIIEKKTTNSAMIFDSSLHFEDNLNNALPKDKNYMFSPLSIKMALAMAANGAEGITKEEILTALEIEDLESFNQWTKDYIQNLPDSENLRLQIANSLWVNESRSYNNYSQEFQKTTADFFYATAETVNDKNAVSTINDWVKKNTKNKIQGVINSPDFEAMLINAIYFKAAWQNEFYKGATNPAIFYNADGSKTKTDFMNRTGYYSYCLTDNGQIIELPYKNRFDTFDENFNITGKENFSMQPSMYILLPNPEKKLTVFKELEQAISSGEFKSTYIKFSMPKFKIEYETVLNKSLQAMGINSVFTRQAELAPMFNSKEQFPNFSQVLHKTYISVDEKGTEAAAVTAIAMATSSLPPKPITLVIDNPFYFVIMDDTSKEVLFMGQYSFANQTN